jgi:hypothetical protein
MDDAQYNATCVSFRGDTLYDVQLVREAVPLPSELRDSLMETAVADLVEAGLSPIGARAEVTRQLLLPQYYPAVRDVLLSAAGELWVRLRTPATSRHALWDVLDRNGRLARRVKISSGFSIKAISGNNLLAVSEDSLGIQYISQLQVRAVPR